MDDTFINPKIEDDTTGLECTQCIKDVFIGGTFEGDSTGIIFDKYSGQNEINGVDMEDNAIVACLENGGIDIYINTSCGNLLHITSTAYLTQVSGGSYGQITIDSGAKHTDIHDLTFDNNGGQTLTDKGTRTILHNNLDADGLVPFPETTLP